MFNDVQRKRFSFLATKTFFKPENIPARLSVTHTSLRSKKKKEVDSIISVA